MSGEEKNAEVTIKEVRLSRKLYPSLSLVEISLYTATWILGVYLACHSLYMASQEQARRLYTVDMVKPWWKFWSSSLMKRDGTDHEWETWKTTSLHGMVTSTPWININLCCYSWSSCDTVPTSVFLF